MTPASDLRALIRRLEAAKEGSRELDAAIAVATFKTISTSDDLIYARGTVRSDGCAPGTYWRKSRSGMSLQSAPEFTRSVDAALTLVPSDTADTFWHIDMQRYSDGWYICMYPVVKRIAVRDRRAEATQIAQLPRALCIASLRARLAEMKEDDR